MILKLPKILYLKIYLQTAQKHFQFCQNLIETLIKVVFIIMLVFYLELFSEDVKGLVHC